jgi:predicted N-acyltransferase
MSKITLKEFKDAADMLLYFYREKSKKREAGWIERTFKKYPGLKNIWSDFDDALQAMEKDTNKRAEPYLKDLKKKGIDIDDIN